MGKEQEGEAKAGGSGKGFIKQIVLILVGLLLIIIGVVSFFAIKSATKKRILDHFVVSGTDHKNYADWATDWDDGDEARYYHYNLWNLTNPGEWAAGTAKASFAEIGPFVYRIYITKVNISFLDGGNQVSYKEREEYIFQPDMSVSDDESTTVFNINPFYVGAISQSAGSENVFDLSLAASAFSAFDDSAAWGAGAPSSTDTPGFFQAYQGAISLTPTESAWVLGAFKGKAANLAGYAQYINLYSTAVSTGDTAKAAGIATMIDATFPGGLDFSTFFSFGGGRESKALLVVKYAASIGGGARAAMITAGVGSEGSLLFRNISARSHIFGPDPFFRIVSGGVSQGYVTNHTLPTETTGQTTCYTGKNDESQGGMDFFTEVEDVTVSTAYHKYMANNATGSGPTVHVNARTQSITFWGSKDTTADQADMYFDDVERTIPFVKGGEVEHQGMDTVRYTGDLASALALSPDWNISHTGFAPLQFWSRGVPFFMSAPHQRYAVSPFATAIDGNNYNTEAHMTFLDFEPTVGLPLLARRSVQINVQLNLASTSYAPVVSGISEPDMMVPLMWFSKSFKISSDGADRLRKGVVHAVVLRRALLGVLVALGAVLLLIGAGLALGKGLSGSGDDGEKNKPTPKNVPESTEPCDSA